MKNLKLPIWISLIWAILICLSGCGGAGSSNSLPSSSGRIAVQIHWPKEGRFVPSVAHHIKFTVTTPSAAVVDTFYATYPTGTATSDVIAMNGGTNAAYYVVTAQSYFNDPQTNTTETPQAAGSTSVVVNGGQTTTFGITMASNVAEFKVAGLGASTFFLYANGTTSTAPSLTVHTTYAGVTITPCDSNGNVVLVASQSTAGTSPSISVKPSADLTLANVSTTLNGTTNFYQADVTTTGSSPASSLEVVYLDANSTGTAKVDLTATFSVVALTSHVTAKISDVPNIFDASDPAYTLAKKYTSVVATLQETLQNGSGQSVTVNTYTSPATGEMDLDFGTLNDNNRAFTLTVQFYIKDQTGAVIALLTSPLSTTSKLSTGPTQFSFEAGTAALYSISVVSNQTIDRPDDGAQFQVFLNTKVNGTQYSLPGELFKLTLAQPSGAIVKLGTTADQAVFTDAPAATSSTPLSDLTTATTTDALTYTFQLHGAANATEPTGSDYSIVLAPNAGTGSGTIG